MKPLVRAFGLTSAVAFAAACASVGGGTGGTVTNGGAGATPEQQTGPIPIWPVKTREHVDLWLHGFAMLQEDTTFVPFFKRGYSTDMIVLKNKANVVTQLDANHDKLRARLTTNPQLVNAQFVPLSFATWGSNVLDLVDTLWQRTYRPRMQRFLNNTQQAQGSVLLSLPLDGEGRSVPGGKQSNMITVTFPERPNDAVEAIYVIAHEAVSGIALTAVADNITPEQRRNGLAERYQSSAAVRAGALLIQRTSPEILDGYMRYYLKSVNRPVGANLQTTFTTTFALADAIRDALTRQLDVVLGGI
jgi:hypothetical protein